MSATEPSLGERMGRHIFELEAQIAALREANESVAVCAQHTDEITDSAGLHNLCLVCEVNVLRATQEKLRDVLLDIKDLIEGYVDVRDSGDGFGVVPNKAMQAEMLIDKALASLSSDPETPK